MYTQPVCFVLCACRIGVLGHLVITFGGKLGRKVRANYLAMTKRLGSLQDPGESICIVEGLHEKSESHTFSEDRGLLFSTQFSQPAL